MSDDLVFTVFCQRLEMAVACEIPESVIDVFDENESGQMVHNGFEELEIASVAEFIFLETGNILNHAENLIFSAGLVPSAAHP